MRRWTADAVSLSRLALLGPWIWCTVTGNAWGLWVWTAIVASDLADGLLARRFATDGRRGALLDPTCDALVVIGAALTLGLSDGRYLGLSGLMAVAFLSWGASSLVGGRLAYTRLGRYNGALCYLSVLVASARPWLLARGAVVPSGVERALLALVAVCLGVSTVENLAVGALRRHRQTAP
ncbi:MAG: CDP-alcohol phosphatidyltransferase family protein [Methanocella sp.]